jgi:SAM-dependent methyltransferase
VQHADHVALLRGGVPGPGGAWADFGAGRGAFTLALAELLGAGSVIYAIDRDAGALRDLRLTLAPALAAGASAGVAERFPGLELRTVAADFTQPLRPPLPALDGLVMANALHFVPDRQKAAVVRLLKGYLKPGGRWLLVEYNVDRGNPWVPHPLAYPTWEALARQCGFDRVRLLATRPSSFLREFYAAESE